MRSDSLKVGCICQVEGSFKVYANAPFFLTMRNGPVRLSASFFLWLWETQVGCVEPYLISYFGIQLQVVYLLSY